LQAEAQRVLGEETLWRAGCEGYVIGRRWDGALVMEGNNPRQANNPGSRILRCGERDVRNRAPAVTGAIATFGGSLLM